MAFAREEVVIDSAVEAADTVMESELVTETVGEEESVTLIVKLKVPLALGVPKITPPLLRVSPVGSVPLETDQL